ncbi:hypothetical protein V5N11_028272 [Cardamine amara subsp. amara]|uniref:DNA-directed RNA polymerase I subunit rpa49 n=1 Tax=Cardamine amara subsp. amara TaxID=228776 RepID=A0ABD1B0Q7_CARAN
MADENQKMKQIAETEIPEEGVRMKIKVEHIRDRPDRIPPIVAYFSTGYDPFAVNPETGEKETPKVTVYRHKDESKKRVQLVVSPPNSNVDFVGNSYSGENAARQTTMYTLGILNRQTKTMKVLPICCNKILRLDPIVRTKATDKATDEAEASGTTDVPELTTGERITETNAKFSTKKVVNRDKKRRALNMGDDDEAQKLIEGKLNDVDVNISALESTSSTVALNIPPYDASATNPEEVYPIGKIIEKGEWDFLQDIYQLLQQGTEAATDSYPVFVRNRLYKLRDIKDETEKETVSGVLSLLTHLIKFKDMNSMNGFDSAKDHRLPKIIRQKCTSLFRDPESERIPVDKAYLLISYILVLSLHVDNFKSDPEDIAKDLRMDAFDLRKHFENLGCKISRGKGTTTTFATLPTPLKFPEIRRRRKTQKR